MTLTSLRIALDSRLLGALERFRMEGDLDDSHPLEKIRITQDAYFASDGRIAIVAASEEENEGDLPHPVSIKSWPQSCMVPVTTSDDPELRNACKKIADITNEGGQTCTRLVGAKYLASIAKAALYAHGEEAFVRISFEKDPEKPLFFASIGTETIAGLLMPVRERDKTHQQCARETFRSAMRVALADESEAEEEIIDLADEPDSEEVGQLSATIPHALRGNIQTFLQDNPDWDADRLVVSAIEGFLGQGGEAV